MAGNAGVTFADLINEAAGILGIYTGDPLTAGEQQSFYFTLTAIIDGYGADALIILQNAILTFQTIANKQTYNIGAANTNDWVTPSLPPSFISVKMLQAGLEYDVDVVTDQEWADIALKGLGSNILTSMWPNIGATSHALSFWPLPSIAQTVNLYVPEVVAKPTSPTNAFIAAPSYQEMMTFELVIKASSKFGAPIPSWIPDAYMEARSKVKAANFQPLYIGCDAALVSSPHDAGGGSLDFYLGR